jgi:hypothetical protein
MTKTRKWMSLLMLLALVASSGCLTVKLNGFQEIAESHPAGMETATSTDDGAALIRDLGRYISELERRLEEGN